MKGFLRDFIDNQEYARGFLQGIIICFIVMFFLIDNRLSYIIEKIDDFSIKLDNIETNIDTLDFGDVCRATGNKSDACSEYWQQFMNIAEENKLPDKVIDGIKKDAGSIIVREYFKNKEKL